MDITIPLARRDAILERLERGEAVVAAALAVEFQVSEDAIRRDLRSLAAEGRCRRVYGGALPLLPESKPMAARIDQDRDRKAALARRAAATVQPGEFLFLDASSTNLVLAEFLPEDHVGTVATNSIDIAAAVLRRGDLSLLMVGGSVDPEVGGCVDAAAVQAVGAMNIDRCFVGACAVSTRTGVSAVHSGDAQFKRALLSASQVCMALITNEKFEARAPHRVAAAKDLDHFVVERNAPLKALDALRSAGAHVLKADRPT
ncbi:DeoR family transcriptional regulator [Roseateles chitinivorans]|uniref:DeoR family transcriptional regulator n=1 Tax=Roseateles chitinivorans TaxID=2917965 RepID=A0A2G9CCS8_9BURK|nr:DeoR/GlpR family DNA-binding transcription regulator [Roseateles chitinivorans]PIM54207.1 DeoR family transcriptional regulator [Roseateles chitinivorans]